MEEKILDVEIMAKWISEQSGIDIDNVLAILDLETAYMEENGFMDVIDDEIECD